MKKKLLSIVLCAVMLFSLCSGAFAADDSELTKLVKLAKGRLEIPEEFTELTSENYNAVGQNTYTLTWSTDEKERSREIRVKILVSGEITSYNYYDSEREYGKRGFAPFEKEEYIRIAKEWSDKANPTYTAEFAKECDYSGGTIHYSDVSVRFNREVNGIPVNGNYVNVTLDKYTGKVISMSSHWSRVKEIKEPQGIIGQDAAAKKLSEMAHLELRYYKLRDENRAVLMYAPFRTDMNIDAFTGENFNVEYVDAEIEEGAAAGGGSASAPMMDSATSNKAEVALTDKELAGIEKLESLLSKAELYEIVKRMKNTNVAYYALKTVNYRIEETDEGKKYYASLYLENGNYSSGRVTLDAETGELISLYTTLAWRVSEKKKNYTPEMMQKNAEAFIDEWARDISDKVKNFNEGIDSEYITFYRCENGIEYRGNSVYMRVDEETGRILSFSKTWDKKTVFDSAEGIISQEEATERYAKAAPPNLLYIANHRVKYATNNADELALIYRLPDDAPSYIDAKSGAAYDWNMGQSAKNDPKDYVLQKDLRGHWAEPIVKKLAENGIVLSYDATFRPNEAIKQKEISVLLECFEGGDRPYAITENDYKQSVERMVRRDIIRKDERNPEKLVTREETVTYLVRMFGFGEAAEFKGIYKTGFADEVAITANKIGYVAIAKGLGLVSGNGGKFNPKNNVTRAELAAMLYNSLKK